MKKVFFLLITLIAMFSCKNEDLINNINGVKGVNVKFSTEGFTEINTRTVNENQLNEITVLEFKDGNLIAKENIDHAVENQSIPLSNMLPLPASNLTINAATGTKTLLEDNHENVIVFIANAKDYLSGLTLENRSTFNEFKELSSNIELSTTIPMVGYHYDGIAEGGNNIINVSLVRTAASINFTLSTSNFKVGKETPNVTVKSITLCNVPKNTTFYACKNRPEVATGTANGQWLNGTMTPFPKYNKDEFTDYDENKNTNLYNVKFYMPENARGSFSSVKSNKDKYPNFIYPDKYETNDENSEFTYVKIVVNYTTSDLKQKETTYRVYLGGNATGDMNILRNVQYNVTTYLYGADENNIDSRITTESKWDPTTVELSSELETKKPANCYIVDPTQDMKDFYIPLTQAYAGWSLIDIMEDSNNLQDFKNLIESGQWEITTLWRTWNGSNLNIKGEKITDADVVEGNERDERKYFAKIKFDEISNIAKTWNIGQNAVIALRSTRPEDIVDGKGKIYWSWHIWFTDYNPYNNGKPLNGTLQGFNEGYTGSIFQQYGKQYGKHMMDRNLGATVLKWDGNTIPSSDNDIIDSYCGLLYQFGRKDPMTGRSYKDYKSMKIYDKDGNETQITFIGNGTTENIRRSIYNPLELYSGRAGAWSNVSYKSKLWNSTSKSPFDPSPAGWRIPVNRDTWGGFTSSTFKVNGRYRIKTDGKNNIVYPYSISRHMDTGDWHSYSSIYSTTESDYQNRSLEFDLGSRLNDGGEYSYRCNAASIRCVEE